MEADNIYNTGETNITLRNTYNPDGSILRKSQLRMLDMLIYIDQVCKLLDIPYIIDGGTVLGAVRHGGFIPWDDDTDIAIPRKYFKKLNTYLEENPHHQYVIQNFRTDKGYMGAWAVLRDTKSEYIQNSHIHKIRKYKGLQVDIFPLEETFGLKIHKFSNSLSYNLIDKMIKKRNIRIAKLGYCLCYKLIFPALRFAAKFYRSNKLMYPLGSPWMTVFDKNIFQERKQIFFEGHYFYGPSNCAEYLRELYGDYMQLPMINKRNHHQATYKIFD